MKFLFYCLQAESRYSYSSSQNRYSHSHKRDRHSHSHCYSSDRQNGNVETLHLFRYFISCMGGDLSLWVAALTHLRIFCIIIFHCYYFYFSSEGKPRADPRIRARRTVTRIRTNETATRMRIVMRATDKTAT